MQPPYFSNGTEHQMWSANWCDRCVRDAFEQSNPGSGKGCPLILKAFLGEEILEWFDSGRTYPDHITCINFKPYGGRGDKEPTPKKPPLGQGQMFEPPEGPRMLSPLEPERVTEGVSL